MLSSLNALLPTKLAVFIFVLYILLFVNQGILVTASQGKNNEYSYNTITVVLFTEVLKLVLSSSLYLRSKTIKNFKDDIVANREVLYLYFIPAVLYCLYNNLAFMNLSTFDPTTYYLLLQFRVVITGILFQIIFSKVLTRKQWVSLLILTCGCMLKQIQFGNRSSTSTSKSTSMEFEESTIFLFIQIVCSCLAGVYNEYLLKKQGANVDIYMQNVFMYIDSIICNIFLLLCIDNISSAFQYDGLVRIMDPKVLIVVLNNALIGIVTSFFLKKLDSILKTFASALELILTAILSWILFGIPIHLNTFLSIVTVLFAVYLYSQNPVKNPPLPANVNNSSSDEAKKSLLLEEV